MNRNDEGSERPALEIGGEIIGAMDEEFHDAPDRVLAIVGAAYLDSLLDQLLRATFVEDKKEVDHLLGPTGPLGSNGSRYQLSYCLGLLDKDQRDDLRLIAKIRNAFAQRYDVRSFEHQDTRKLLAKLHYGKELDAIVSKLIKDTTDPEQQNHLREIGASGRRKFQDTVRNLFITLLQCLDRVNRPDRATWYRGEPQ
jgi:DNA-binding MltR family transcriptional regulator